MLFEVLKRGTADLRGQPRTQAMDEIREGLSMMVMREITRQLSVKGRVEEIDSPW